MKRRISILSICIAVALSASAQIRYGNIAIPNIPGFITLKCDFHLHTIHSDGNVTPDVRVFEAVSEGLDAIAITDHVYSKPANNRANEPDRNKAYEEATKWAQMFGLLVIKGVEISRGMPPGHINAIFLNDANKMITPDGMDAYKEAKNQKGFIFWNHPGDQSDYPIHWHDYHTTMLQDGLLQGVEVVNTGDYYPEAHQWCLDKNLAMLGNSDAHFPTSVVYDFERSKHRPMTLVFAKERSVESIEEALRENRTVVYHDDLLIGREELLKPLFDACIEITNITRSDKRIDMVIKNKSEIPFLLKQKGHNPAIEYPRELKVNPHSIYLVKIKLEETTTPILLNFTVENMYAKPNQGLEYQLSLD